MRKLTFSAAFFILANFAFAGGLLTNTNQSAQFIRMLSRKASLDIDAVYYNPAGLIKLEDGWHFAVSSQTIFQERNMYSEYPLLNDLNYLGTTKVPVFPNAYAAYKNEKWAFSFGFGPNAGGGTVEYERGLPTFEIPISVLGSGLQRLSPLMSMYDIPSVNDYKADLYFKGSSIFWGFQLGATYEINEKLSVFAGVRILSSKNTYLGEIKGIAFETSGGEMASSDYLQLSSPVLTATINTFNTTASVMNAAIEAELINPTDPVSNPQLISILTLLGYPEATNEQAVGILTQSATTIENLKNADVSNKTVDTEQSGTGFTPILGLNFSPNEDWNIGIKYEHKTYMTLDNKPNPDNNYNLWGNKVNSDMPGILGIGLGYKGLDWLEAQFSYTGFFDKRVNWGNNLRDATQWGSIEQSKVRHRDINKSSYEVALGLQFNISEKFALSVGGLYGGMGADESYQSDFSYTNNYFTLGGGFMWKITNKLKFDAGVSNVFYKDDTVTFEDPYVPAYNDVYGKSALTLAAGLSYSIF